ncbi:MAG: MOSC domain-containing protein [Pseudomonadota bacterium]
MQVTQIGQVFVKATQFLTVDAAEIEADGIRFDRSFALIEQSNEFIGSTEHSQFMPLRFNYDHDANSLELTLPDGQQIVGPSQHESNTMKINHVGLRDIEVAVVGGPWTDVLSEYAGRSIRLVRCLTKQAGIDVFPITFVTTASMRRLERELGESVDPVRFRAGFVIDNDIEHEEDGWDGRLLKVGTSTLRVRTPVPRCQITGYNPKTGKTDQAVMKSLIKYREKVQLPDGMMPDYSTPGFATYTEIVEPGSVKVGDEVLLIGE